MRNRNWVLTALLACFTTMALTPAYATFPGQNGLIAFAAQADPNSPYEIYTVQASGSNLHQITHTSADSIRPNWSPDGRLIVFEIDYPDRCSVALMNHDGSNIVELTPKKPVCENAPSFTPDGARIMFDRFDPITADEAFWTMDLTGKDRQRVGQCCADPEVSPNGERFSYLGFNGEPIGTALFTADINGSNVSQLTPFSFDVAVKQDWAPDGERIVFSQYGDNHIPGVSTNIATIRPDGTHLRLLTHYKGGDVNAFVGSYSPDGRWIAFRLQDHGRFGLYEIHPDGSGVHAILPLSAFKPRYIDWGAKASEDVENPGTPYSSPVADPELQDFETAPFTQNRASYFACLRYGQQCRPGYKCCPGLTCVPASTRAFCLK